LLALRSGTSAKSMGSAHFVRAVFIRSVGRDDIQSMNLKKWNTRFSLVFLLDMLFFYFVNLKLWLKLFFELKKCFSEQDSIIIYYSNVPS
jgi:hypothetical protein